MKKIKVVMLVDAWFPHVGGGQIHVREIAKRLNDYNIDVTVVTRNLGNSIDNDFKVVKLGKVKKFESVIGRLEYLLRAFLYCLNNEYDILHAHAFSPGLIVPIINLIRKRPTVFTVHGKGVIVAGFGMKASFLERLVVYKNNYDLVITVAKDTIRGLVNSKRLVVIPNGVDIGFYKQALRKRAKVKQILFVGRLSCEKGVDLLINAFNSVNDSNLELVVVGEGDQLNLLKKMVLTDRIRFLGKLEGNELVEKYCKADLLVIPSRTEGLPLVLFEAWASKLPVLATKVGDIPHYIKDGINGFLCFPTKNSLYENLKRIITYSNYEAIGKSAYKDVYEYTWDNIAARTAKEYRRLVK